MAEQVVHTLDETWPQDVIDAAGALPEFPSAEDLRKGYARDTPRESLA